MSYLLKYDGNYADEFDVHYATILSNQDYKVFTTAVNLFQDKDFEYYFGTNECLIFDLSMDIFEIKEISQMDAYTLSYYSLHNTGIFEYIVNYLMDSIQDDNFYEAVTHITLG